MTPQGGPMSSDLTTAIVQRFFDEVCNGRNKSAADELFAPTHQYHDPSSPWVGPGPEGMKQLTSMYYTAFADALWNVDEMIAGERRDRRHPLDGARHAYGGTPGTAGDGSAGDRSGHLDSPGQRRSDPGELERVGHARHAAAARRRAEHGRRRLRHVENRSMSCRPLVSADHGRPEGLHYDSLQQPEGCQPLKRKLPDALKTRPAPGASPSRSPFWA